MYSSRMRTGRSLTVCCSLLPGGGGGRGLPARGGFSLVWGGVLPGPGGGVSLVLGGLLSPGGGGGFSGDPPPRGQNHRHV